MIRPYRPALRPPLRPSLHRPSLHRPSLRRLLQHRPRPVVYRPPSAEPPVEPPRPEDTTNLNRRQRGALAWVAYEYGNPPPERVLVRTTLSSSNAGQPPILELLLVRGVRGGLCYVFITRSPTTGLGRIYVAPDVTIEVLWPDPGGPAGVYCRGWNTPQEGRVCGVVITGAGRTEATSAIMRQLVECFNRHIPDTLATARIPLYWP